MVNSLKACLLLAPLCSAAVAPGQKSCRTLITDCPLTRSPTTSYSTIYAPCYTTSVSTSTSNVQSTIVSTSTAVDPVSTILSTDSIGLTLTVTGGAKTISVTETVPVTTVSVMLTWEHAERIVTKLPPAGFKPIKETIEKGECLDPVMRKNKGGPEPAFLKVFGEAISEALAKTGGTAGAADTVEEVYCPSLDEAPIYPGDVKCTDYLPSPTCVTQKSVVTATAPTFPLIATSVTTSTATRTLVPNATVEVTVLTTTTTIFYVTSVKTLVTKTALTSTATATFIEACKPNNYLKQINGYGIVGAELAYGAVKDIADSFFAKSEYECCTGALEQLGGSAFQCKQENGTCYPYYKQDSYDPKDQLGVLLYDSECSYGYTWGNGYRGQWDQYQCVSS